MDIDGITSSDSRFQVSFVTKLQPPWKAPTNSLAVPSYLTRMGLSELVNHMLKEGNSDHQHQSFDFLIHGELVRMSLEQFLLAKEISTEKVLEIEYIKAIAPREEKDPCLHDDWASAVDGSDPRFILTRCYDNITRIWKTGTFWSHILEGHTSAVTSVHILNTKGIENGDIHLATGSKDRTLRTLRLWIVCGKALNCLDVGGESSALIAAGGSDPILRIWDPRKPGSLAPVFQFSSHSSWITACKWHSRSLFHLVSASYNGKVMLWDLRTAVQFSTYNMKLVLLAIRLLGQQIEVLCADWWKDDSVISGGADSKLCTSSGISIQ